MTSPNNVVTESRALALLGAASLIALILLCAAWELWLAPVRPGGSWLALKALLLAWPLPGVLRLATLRGCCRVRERSHKRAEWPPM